MIDSGDASGTGIVLTSANLIRANKPLAKDHRGRKDRYEYHPGAQVTVHLLDDTTAEGRLLYHQEHYDIALFKVEVDHRVQLASFADTVDDGQEENDERHGKNVWMARGKGPYIRPKCDDGGDPVIDIAGKFEAIKFLDPTHAEYIWRKLNIDDGLVVEELENKLLSICRGNFDRGTDINAKVDVSVKLMESTKLGGKQFMVDVACD
ncbi:uncharacterized protein [Aegilops tauschii subsp. strangulata]|uniref:uncharacterized protein n=1 Tax=Aegilops tauschii subsp. strangulata TaxID=200361 RepID=UPI003CC862CF